jgi:hypothetical protein
VDLKELNKLIALLRKSGVSSYKTPELELVLTEAPVAVRRSRTAKNKAAPVIDDVSGIPTDGISEEALLMWSSDTGIN